MRFRQETRTGEQETFRPAATTSRTLCCAQRLLAMRHNSGSGTSGRRRGRAANQCRRDATAPRGPLAQYRGSDLKLAAGRELTPEAMRKVLGRADGRTAVARRSELFTRLLLSGAVQLCWLCAPGTCRVPPETGPGDLRLVRAEPALRHQKRPRDRSRR